MCPAFNNSIARNDSIRDQISSNNPNPNAWKYYTLMAPLQITAQQLQQEPKPKLVELMEEVVNDMRILHFQPTSIFIRSDFTDPRERAFIHSSCPSSRTIPHSTLQPSTRAT